MTPAYRYRAEVDRVIDGDTYLLNIDLGFHVHAHQSIRLRGVNCPERNTEAGKVAKVFVHDIFAATNAIVVETYKDKQTFARWVADVYVGNDSLGYLIVAAGHGVYV